jgi:hypothetical protein
MTWLTVGDALVLAVSLLAGLVVLVLALLFIAGAIIRRDGFEDPPLPPRPSHWDDTPEYWEDGRE